MNSHSEGCRIVHLSSASELVEIPGPRATKYGILRSSAFEGDRDMPTEVDVVVIGGGIIGATTAYYLAKRNIRVLLCEKAEIGCEASSRAFGWISELMLDPVKQPLTQSSKRLWRELQTEIGEVGYREDGLIYLAETPEEMSAFEEWITASKGHLSPGTTLLDADQVAARFPTASKRFAGGLLSPTDGAAEPVIAATEIANAARQAGARIVTDCAVRGLDLQDGKVVGVHTEKGYVKTPQAVCAMHSWTRLFLGNHGVDVPQMYMFMSMGRTSCLKGVGPVGAGGTNKWAWRRQMDGCFSLGGMMGIGVPITRDAIKLKKLFDPLTKAVGITGKPDFGRDAWNDWKLKRRWDPRKTSPFEKLRVLGGSVIPVANQSYELNAQIFPEFMHAHVEEMWAGPLVVTPDNKPIIGPVEGISGLQIVTGCGYGFNWAPGIGNAVAAVIAGDETEFDLKPFRLSRFTDGSKLSISL